MDALTMQTLAAGTTLRDYTIISVVGIGGMGEVYKAYDPRLGRNVALKILAPNLTGVEDLLERFVQEAKAASALNHPNIVTIHEIGEGEVVDMRGKPRHIHFIAMELIEGETLRKKMHQSDFGMRQRMRILSQAAEGLAKAHASGIVHRDLKPENIMVTPDGFAKILDFGLAKLVEYGSPFHGSETKTAIRNPTNAGVIMGTFGYMAPEQIEGRQVDHRADIFAFGCIIYQAITGRIPFGSDSTVDTIHNIVHAQPEPILELVPDAPPELERIIRRCLAKDPDERYQSIREVAIELREIERQFDTSPPTSTRRVYIRKERESWVNVALVVAIVIALAIVSGLLFRTSKRPTSEEAPFDKMSIRRVSGTNRSVAMSISPDGKYLLHAVEDNARQSLLLRQIETGSDVVLVPMGDSHFVDAVFSPDGNYIYYVGADNETDVGTIYRLPALGGNPPVRVLTDFHNRISVSPDGRQLAFVQQDRRAGESYVGVVASSGGAVRKIGKAKLPDLYSALTWSADSRRIFAARGAFTEKFETQIVEIDLATSKATTVEQKPWRAIESIARLGNGSLLVNGKETLTSARNQLWLIDVQGRRRRVTNDLNDYEGLSVTADGSALVTLQKSAGSRVVVIPDEDFTKARFPLPPTGNIDGLNGVSWAPDGRIVFVSESSDERDLWIADPARGSVSRLTDGHTDVLPAVSPDGRHVFFVSLREGRPNIWRVDSDGSAPTRLTTGVQETSPDVSPDGQAVYFHTNRAGVRTIWRVPAGGGEPKQVTRVASSWPSVSPDGKQIACSWWDAASSKAKIAIIPSEGGTPARLLDIPVNFWLGANNHVVRWALDGKALYFVKRQEGASNVWRLFIESGEAKQVTKFTEGHIYAFDLSANGRDLVCAQGEVTSNIVLIKDFAGAAPN